MIFLSSSQQVDVAPDFNFVLFYRNDENMKLKMKMKMHVQMHVQMKIMVKSILIFG